MLGKKKSAGRRLQFQIVQHSSLKSSLKKLILSSKFAMSALSSSILRITQNFLPFTNAFIKNQNQQNIFNKYVSTLSLEYLIF